MLSPSPNSKVPLPLGQESTNEKVYSQLLSKELRQSHYPAIYITPIIICKISKRGLLNSPAN